MNASLRVAFILISSMTFVGCSSGGSSSASTGGFTTKPNEEKAATLSKFQAQAIDYSKIEDPKLRQCIEESGATDTSPQAIACSGLGIESLSGIEQFEDVRVLDLSNNKLTEVAELSSLKRITSVNLNTNRIASLKSLADSSSLKKIIASNNEIDSLEGVSGLSSLKNLYVDNNRIADFGELNHLNSLEYLTAENNSSSIPSSLPHSLKSFRL